MAGRTPSFVVVGLVLVMFLLGFFYMSCSTKTTELRQTLDEFEDRIRTLTLKNSDNDRKIETIMARKSELEEENSNIQRQMRRQDSELSDLNTKFNEKQAEYQSLKSDNQVLDREIKDHKNISQMHFEKTLAMQRLQREFDEQNRTNTEQLNQLKQEIENYKNQLKNSQINEEKPLLIPSQRFQPILSSNETVKNTSSILQEPLAKLSNIANEIKEQIAPIVSNIKEQVLNKLGMGDNSSVNQNQRPNSPNANKRLRRSSNDSILDNKSSNNTDNNHKQSLDINTAQKTLNLSSIALVNDINIANNQSNIEPSQLAAPEKNYRIDNREQVAPIRKNIKKRHQQPLANDQEVIDKNNQQQIPESNIF